MHDAPSKKRGGNTSAQALWQLQTFKQMLNELAGAKQRGEVNLTFAPDTLTEQLRQAAANSTATRKAPAEQTPAGFMTPSTASVRGSAADDSAIRQQAAELAQQLAAEGTV